MKYPISEGKYYKIVGATDGTVTDASGNVIVSYTAGEEVTFTAPAGDYVNINPSGNILSNYATITYVDEAIAAFGSFDMAAYNAFYGKYINCTTVNEVSTINIVYKNDLTSWGEWIYKLPKLTDGSNMFRLCSNLTSFSGDLSSLTNGLQMFERTSLTSFSSDLPKLTSGTSMFIGCSNLTEWNTPLPALTSGEQMFNGCSNLTEWNTPLPNLTDGSSMFNGCSNLTEWNTPLPNLTNGGSMFLYCTNLISFSSDLPNLTNGYWMFYNCKLDAASVERILSTIPTYTDGSTYQLTLHFSSEAAAKFEEITGVTPTTTQQTVSYKGWTIYAQIYNA